MLSLIIDESRGRVCMRYICIILGFLTGKIKVKCVECKNLDAIAASVVAPNFLCPRVYNKKEDMKYAGHGNYAHSGQVGR